MWVFSIGGAISGWIWTGEEGTVGKTPHSVEPSAYSFSDILPGIYHPKCRLGNSYTSPLGERASKQYTAPTSREMSAEAVGPTRPPLYCR